MQKKLLYSSVLCALFSISGIVFGMEKNDPTDKYTFLTLTVKNDFFIVSPSGFTKHNKNDFNKEWNEQGFQQFTQRPDYSRYSFSKPARPFDLSFSQLIITDTNDKNITLSIITPNTSKAINLGDFEKKQIEDLKSFHTYGCKIEVFRTGFYYPIDKIIHKDHLNNPIEIIHVE